MLSERFRLTYCRFCANSRLDPDRGTVCGLAKTPVVRSDECPEFVQNKKRISETIEKQQLAELEDTKSTDRQALITLAWALPFLILMSIGWYGSYKLSKDYRYTVAKVEMISQSGLIDKFLWFGGFDKKFRLIYRIDGIYYESKQSLENEEKLGLPDKVLIKYSDSDRENIEMLREVDVTGILLRNVPDRGVDKDSLDWFLGAMGGAQKSPR